jgi:hypothetical protein
MQIVGTETGQRLSVLDVCDEQSALLLSLNNATVMGVEHVQLSQRQS